ncbi:MAG: hypothetical protein J6K75_08360 [Erysipelotrichaceae bacterium]|nr:hypothetical protein [Erysipelotrichaceae bacterium]MBQ7888717.1 hypothetical protein [Erysipelotrichaceae bacterium]
MSKDFWNKMDEFDRAAEKSGGYVVSKKLTKQEIQDINKEIRKRKLDDWKVEKDFEAKEIKE